MRNPRSLIDDALLLDEPFCTHFPKRLAQNGQQNTSENIAWLDGIVKKVIDLENDSGMRAVQSWCIYAFKRDHECDPSLPIPNIVIIKIFIRFFWLRYIGKEDVELARSYLIEERRKREYNSLMPILTSKFTNHQHRRQSQITVKPEIDHPSGSLSALSENQLDPGKMNFENIDIKANTQFTPSENLKRRGNTLTGLRFKRYPHVKSNRDSVSCGPEKIEHPRRADEKQSRETPVDVRSDSQRIKREDSIPLDIISSTDEQILKMVNVDDQECLPYLLDASFSKDTTAPAPYLSPQISEPFEDSFLKEVTNNSLPPESSINPFVSDKFDLDEEESTEDATMFIGDEKSISLLNDVTSTYQLPLPMYPPVWAQSRQEICESFGWFRSYQGGVYYSRNVVKGYLLSAFSSCRDRFDHGGRLIISHGGGKGESLHSCKGQISTQTADDQLAQDKSVRALLRNYHESRPLVLLIDDKYVLFPYDLSAKEVTYAVLGYYIIANAWAEYQPANNERGRVIRYKFAFQWCEDQGKPWWLGENGDNAVIDKANELSLTDISQKLILPEKLCEHNLSQLRPPIPDFTSSICDSCFQKSPQVYVQSWACLNPSCNKFWITPHNQPLPYQLDYNPRFLELLPAILSSRGYGRLLPSLPLVNSKNEAVTDYTFSRGWHCSNCGRLSCRFKWEQWECMQCQAVYRISIKLRSERDFWAHSLQKNLHDYHIARESGIRQQPQVLFSHGHGMGQFITFILPYDRGCIHLIRSGCPEGRIDADIVFREYQEQASSGQLAFRRWPMRSHKCRGALLTNYYSQNAGEPYQYVGGAANTVPFNEAPSAVVKAREMIQRRLQQALGLTENFNEILSAAYMERQKMAFHSDSEKGLGPVVAGLSLGAPAVMHFRLHHKFDPFRELGYIALSVVLRHGDVLVMDGAGVQEYYEHTVIPTDLRIAATARCINANHA